MEIGSVRETDEVEVGGVWAIAQVKIEHQNEEDKCNDQNGIVDGQGMDKFNDQVSNAQGQDMNEFNDQMGKESDQDRDIIDDKTSGLGVWKVVQHKRKNSTRHHALKEICVVQREKKKLISLGRGEITVDSAAEESVCPKEWGEACKTELPQKWMKFMNASGGRMGHYGAKEAMFKTGGQSEKLMSLGFQVSDVQKPLAAVWRIAEKGNIVQFGPKEEDNYIQNVQTGQRLLMTRKGGSYVLDAEFMIEEDKVEPGFPRRAMTNK